MHIPGSHVFSRHVPAGMYPILSSCCPCVVDTKTPFAVSFSLKHRRACPIQDCGLYYTLSGQSISLCISVLSRLQPGSIWMSKCWTGVWVQTNEMLDECDLSQALVLRARKSEKKTLELFPHVVFAQNVVILLRLFWVRVGFLNAAFVKTVAAF